MREKMFNRIAVMLLLLMVSGVFAIAQNTTSTIVGTVADAEDNLPGAIVKVTEIETGTVYAAVSNSKGQFRINGVQPGGP
ncbi:carboxypeptidase-like regulatory domain-containing protein [Prevotella sp. P5-92]|uniref:carboxypeptidase-like regulatory domain-containing protein n=1 Tax=Prevotella sp. P5-92 TaxID=2024222 RepID=UPI001303D11B|nr:carboxypeptidase-like regulatory domain-containing protein [Prevotella sp. P5-92]